MTLDDPKRVIDAPSEVSADAIPARTTNRAATAGYVLGICSVFVAGLFGVVGTLAIVFSAIGLRRTARMPEGGRRRTARRRAITGIIFGSVSVVMSIAVIVLLAVTYVPRISAAKVERAIQLQPVLPGVTLTQVKCPPNPKIVVGQTFECTGYVLGGGTEHYTVTMVTSGGEVSWRPNDL